MFYDTWFAIINVHSNIKDETKNKNRVHVGGLLGGNYTLL